MGTRLNIHGTGYSDCTDAWTFGGFEAVKHVLAQPILESCLGIVEDHFARAYPDSMIGARVYPNRFRADRNIYTYTHTSHLCPNNQPSSGCITLSEKPDIINR